MEVRIQAIHFDISETLTAFINKKAERLARHHEAVSTLEAILKVVKPASAMNKEVTIRVVAPQQPEIAASKTADSFEEAVDLALEAIDRQLAKRKDQK